MSAVSVLLGLQAVVFAMLRWLTSLPWPAYVMFMGLAAVAGGLALDSFYNRGSVNETTVKLEQDRPPETAGSLDVVGPLVLQGAVGRDLLRSFIPSLIAGQAEQSAAVDRWRATTAELLSPWPEMRDGFLAPTRADSTYIRRLFLLAHWTAFVVPLIRRYPLAYYRLDWLLDRLDLFIERIKELN